jgi:methylated-DNA-[protein]-cysteine S-methyltransferase
MTDTLNYLLLDSPLGSLRLLSNGTALLAIEFPGRHDTKGTPLTDPVLRLAASQLEQYFAGRRKVFKLPLAAAGTQFQHQVWAALQEIPFGEVRSYRDIAQSIGNHKAVRAVGAANGRNPLPIVVPCHRVIGSDGSLTGFAGGLDAKRALLGHEGVATADAGTAQAQLSF